MPFRYSGWIDIQVWNLGERSGLEINFVVGHLGSIQSHKTGGEHQGIQCGEREGHKIIVAVVQLLSCVWFFATAWTAARQPSLPFHSLLESAPFHVHWVCDDLTIYLILCCTLLLLPLVFPVSGFIPVSWLFASGDHSIGASASVFPMNIQGWFHFRLTGLISLQS